MSYDANNSQPYGGSQSYGGSQPTGPGASYGAPAYGAPAGGQLGTTNPDDLSLPLYGASFGQASKRFFKNYAKFTGRASRSEYWWATLMCALLQVVPAILLTIGVAMTVSAAATMDPYATTVSAGPSGAAMAMTAIGGILSGIVFLAIIVPTLAISWRRLHDANFPGPFYFLTLIPSIGSIIVLVLMLMPTKPEGRRFDA